ncbi:MAG TPA: TMEM175 family protein [Novosphingobium sp.]|nr:TMEM175 family protein [Novosphingobium sp.]
MNSDRLKALTDGVVAVIITIMVLEMKPPPSAAPAALLALAPVLLSYVLSFVYVAIYWNNHHHFFALTPRVSAGIMWANFNLLFWLSLIPFATAWMGEHELQAWPTAVYGGVLLACALSWYLMQSVIIRAQGPQSDLRRAIGRDWKGKFSPPLYAAGMALSFWRPALAALIYAFVALLWLVPDSRVHQAASRGA